MTLRYALQSERLHIAPIQNGDAEFMQRLVNTEGWIQYIGQRNIDNVEEAEKYIQRMNTADNCQTWSVKFMEDERPIGIITLVKRDYLDSHDLGFAFLPEYQNRGFAFEAANAVLSHLRQAQNFEHLYAITIPENSNSMRLLEKLGFRFEKEIAADDEQLWLFRIE